MSGFTDFSLLFWCYVCGHTCVHDCMWETSEDNLRHSSDIVCFFFKKNFFWQRVSHWLGTSSSKLGYGWPRSLLSLPSWLLDYKCVCHHAWLFMWVLGNSNLPPHFTPKPSLQRCVLKFWHSGGCSSHFSLQLEKPRFRPEGLEGWAFYNKPSPVFLASSLWTYVAVP